MTFYIQVHRREPHQPKTTTPLTRMGRTLEFVTRQEAIDHAKGLIDPAKPFVWYSVSATSSAHPSNQNLRPKLKARQGLFYVYPCQGITRPLKTAWRPLYSSRNPIQIVPDTPDRRIRAITHGNPVPHQPQPLMPHRLLRINAAAFLFHLHP